MMTWQAQMAQAMDTIQKVCKEQNKWDRCAECPFDRFCTALMEAELIDPFEGINWKYGEETD
ncbi:MAG: hypothetical protein LIR50_21370 [Bacillota bacterium]|nr:hypothetical protein [Bacillota bacterium]